MKKLFCIVTVTMLVLFLGTKASLATVITAPQNIAVAKGFARSITVTYKISTINPGDNHTLAASSYGEFRKGSLSLGLITGEVTAGLNDSGSGIFRGTVSETIILSTAVIKRAADRRINRFEYGRVFSLSGGPGPAYNLSATVQITVKAAGGAEFNVTGLRVYFDNNRDHLTVKQGQTALKAYADINYVGGGLLQGFWQVDGRLLGNVNKHLSLGKMVTLMTPEEPELPAFSVGPHVVMFVLTKPEQDIVLPKAIYHVAPGEVTETAAVTLTAPADKAQVESAEVAFKWLGTNEATAFLIEFFEDGTEKPIYSAFTEEPEYRLPPVVLKYYFSPGEAYFWRIKAFDSKHTIISISPIWEFSLE